MFRNQYQQQEMIAAAREENAKKDLLAKVYASYPTVIPCMANDKAIIELIVDWTNDPKLAPSFQLFEEMMEENPDAINLLATRPVERSKTILIEDIIALLRAKGKGHDAWTLKNEERRLATYTLTALRTRLADLQRAAGMASMSVPQLRQVVADNRPSHAQFPALPKTIWNGTTDVPMDAKFFRSLPVFEIKRYNRIYSEAAVNARIQQGS